MFNPIFLAFFLDFECVKFFTQRILQHDSEEDILKSYKLNAVTYRKKPAEFVQYSWEKQARQEKYPIGCKAVLRDFYVDNLKSSGNSVEAVWAILKEITELLERGEFKIRKWCSNHKQPISNQDERKQKPEKHLTYMETTQ